MGLVCVGHLCKGPAPGSLRTQPVRMQSIPTCHGSALALPSTVGNGSTTRETPPQSYMCSTRRRVPVIMVCACRACTVSANGRETAGRRGKTCREHGNWPGLGPVPAWFRPVLAQFGLGGVVPAWKVCGSGRGRLGRAARVWAGSVDRCGGSGRKLAMDAHWRMWLGPGGVGRRIVSAAAGVKSFLVERVGSGAVADAI